MLFDVYRSHDDFSTEIIRRIELNRLYQKRGVQKLCESCHYKYNCAVLLPINKQDSSVKFICFDYKKIEAFNIEIPTSEKI